MSEPRQVWPLRSECCGRGAPTNVVCADCMKMCCLGGKNSVPKALMTATMQKCILKILMTGTVSQVPFHNVEDT